MINRKIQVLFSLGFFLMILIASCSKSSEVTEVKAPFPPADNYSARATLDHPGRTLSANCFQCHGTNGYAGELKIAGMGYSELMSKLTSYRTRDPKSDIMYFHALAYTDTEISLIADYFSQQ
jgi:cytochrome c553